MKLMGLKKYIKGVLISMVLIASVFVFSGCNAMFLGFNTSHDINDEKSISTSGINKIYINTISAEVNIIPTDSNELKAHYYGNVRVRSTNRDERPELQLISENGSIKASEHNSGGLKSLSYSGNLKMDIYIPKNYEGDVSINTVSGKVNAGNSISSYNINTVSGEVTYSEDNELKNNITIGSVSGRININLPSNADFRLNASSISGKVMSNFDSVEEGKNVESTVGSGKYLIEAKTVSGRISVNK